MKPKWSKNEAEIVDLLRDYKWHCPTIETTQKDDRARITTIRRKLHTVGYDIKSAPCTIHKHESRILMRKIVKQSHECLECLAASAALKAFNNT